MEQIITKLEAAIRQLDCAIDLYFNEKDAVSIHTLACAAHQIIHNINTDQNGPELLFDNVDTRKAGAKVTRQLLHKHYNFFKHADNDPCPNCGVWFDNEITDIFLLSAIIGVYYIRGSINKLETGFIVYFQIRNGDFLSQDIVKMVTHDINPKFRQALVGLNKRDYLRSFLESMG